jgi:predicted unusual protein kinase regulating ubiquinone biosynthesis (AarF/ABC1/UbiB family)
LLFAIESDGNWRQRVMTVVGMEAYIAAISRHADQLTQMATDMQLLLQKDMSTFNLQYESLLNRIQSEAEELFLLDQYLAQLNTYLKERQTLVQKRTTELQDQQKNLDTMTTEANKEIAKLNAIQNDLFTLQQRLGVTVAKNDKLEAELRKLEQKK